MNTQQGDGRLQYCCSQGGRPTLIVHDCAIAETGTFDELTDSKGVFFPAYGWRVNDS